MLICVNVIAKYCVCVPYVPLLLHETQRKLSHVVLSGVLFGPSPIVRSEITKSETMGTMRYDTVWLVETDSQPDTNQKLSRYYTQDEEVVGLMVYYQQDCLWWQRAVYYYDWTDAVLGSNLECWLLLQKMMKAAHDFVARCTSCDGYTIDYMIFMMPTYDWENVSMNAAVTSMMSIRL